MTSLSVIGEALLRRAIKLGFEEVAKWADKREGTKAVEGSVD